MRSQNPRETVHVFFLPPEKRIFHDEPPWFTWIGGSHSSKFTHGFFRGDDVVFFEVMEINGRYEAVKMLLPSMMETQLGSVTWCSEQNWFGVIW